MNRRGFIRGLAGALAGFTILPAATTYGRVWRAKREIVIPNVEFEQVKYEILWACPYEQVLRIPPDLLWAAKVPGVFVEVCEDSYGKWLTVMRRLNG